MCVDHRKLDIVRAGAVFNQPGTHRRSPWFMAASALKLNDIGPGLPKLTRAAK